MEKVCLVSLVWTCGLDLSEGLTERDQRFKIKAESSKSFVLFYIFFCLVDWDLFYFCPLRTGWLELLVFSLRDERDGQRQRDITLLLVSI